MATELRATLVIDAQTDGEKNVEALVIDLEKLAADGGDSISRSSVNAKAKLRQYRFTASEVDKVHV